MPRQKYKQVEEDEAIVSFEFSNDGAITATGKIACCDCGLVHNWHYVVEPYDDKPGGMVSIYAIRENRSTAAIRRNGNVALLRGDDEKWVMGRREDVRDKG